MYVCPRDAKRICGTCTHPSMHAMPCIGVATFVNANSNEQAKRINKRKKGGLPDLCRKWYYHIPNKLSMHYFDSHDGS